MNISGGKLVAIRAGNIEQQKDGTRNKPKRSPSFSRHEKNSLFVIVQDAPTNTTQRDIGEEIGRHPRTGL